MTITVNSKVCEVPEGTTVGEFLESAGENPRRCVVELNGEAMAYGRFAEIVLRGGDVLEIMRVVAGG